MCQVSLGRNDRFHFFGDKEPCIVVNKAELAQSKTEGRDDNAEDGGKRYQGALEKGREQKSAQVTCNMVRSESGSRNLNGKDVQFPLPNL